MPIFPHMDELNTSALRRRGLLFLGLLNLLAAVLVISYGVAAWSDLKSAIRGDEKLQITVTGEGKVTAKPDVAKITATILTEKASLEDAQAENSRKSQAVTGYLKGEGVQEKDIKTVSYNISPQYSYPPPCRFPIDDVCLPEDRRPKIIGYQIRNAYEVTIRDLGKAGVILSGVVSAGVNEVYGITFTIDNPDSLKAEARKKAISEAREKAKVLSGDLDRRLGNIVNFSDGGSFPQPIFYERAAVSDGKGGGGVPPSVEAGENEVIVTVSITYEFK